MRAGAAIARQRGDHDVWIHRTQLLYAESEPIHDTDAEIVDYHVADGDESCDDVCGIGMGQVDADAALVGVVELKQTGGVV